MPFFATAGSKVYIGGIAEIKYTDFVLADFDGETWVEVGGIDNIGTFGDRTEPVSDALIGCDREFTLKGIRSAGMLDLIGAINYADAGQIALIAAEKTDFDYAFKIVFKDAPSGGTPSERYFIAKVMSASEQLDGANNVMKFNSSLAVNSNFVRVAAAAGT